MDGIEHLFGHFEIFSPFERYVCICVDEVEVRAFVIMCVCVDGAEVRAFVIMRVIVYVPITIYLQ